MISSRNAARLLGRRGGLMRAKRLSTERRREIAAGGGRARSLSLQAARRIEENFRYLEAARNLTWVSKVSTHG